MKIKKVAVVISVSILLIVTSVWTGLAKNKKSGLYVPGGRNVMAHDYTTLPDYPPIPDRANFIGLVEGNWYKMGVKLGKGAGDLLRVESEIYCETALSRHGVENTREAIKRYEVQINALSPNLISFIQGIADGAAPWLSQSKHAQELTNYEMVFIPSAIEWVYSPSGKYPWEAGGCSAFAAKGQATVNGGSLHVHNRHTSLSYAGYNQVYVSKPNDGNTFWVLGFNPYVTGNQVVNDKGVSISILAGGKPTPDAIDNGIVARDFGVPVHILFLYIAAYANSAEEAIEIVTLGTKSYRKSTGRNSLLGCSGVNLLISDEDTLAVVERLPHRYRVRYPGDCNGPDWNSKNYIVVTNHFICEDSRDEDNVLTDIPMTAPTTSVAQGSVDRFWTFMWDVEHNYGNLDKYKAMHLATVCYKKDQVTGEKIEAGLDELGDPQPWYKIGACNDPYRRCPDSKVALLNDKSTEVYWTQGPAMDWEGAWDAYYFKHPKKK